MGLTVVVVCARFAETSARGERAARAVAPAVRVGSVLTVSVWFCAVVRVSLTGLSPAVNAMALKVLLVGFWMFRFSVHVLHQVPDWPFCGLLDSM